MGELVTFSNSVFEIALNSVCNLMHLWNWGCQNTLTCCHTTTAGLLMTVQATATGMPKSWASYAKYTVIYWITNPQSLTFSSLRWAKEGKRTEITSLWPYSKPARARMKIQESGITSQAMVALPGWAQPLPWCPKWVTKHCQWCVSLL